MTQATGNARLIHLHRLDWSEIRAIVARGREVLADASPDLHPQAQWRAMLEKAKKYRRPVDRQWLADPLRWASCWEVGSTLLVNSRGYLPENVLPRDSTASLRRRVKAGYESEFRFDRSSIEVAMGLEDIKLMSSVGSVLAPLERSNVKPWANYPGGKQALIEALLRRAKDELPAGSGLAGDIESFLAAT